MNTHRPLSALLLLGSLTYLTGCASLSPTPQASLNNTTQIPDQWESSQRYVNTTMSTQLLSLFNNQALAELVKEALSNNHDLHKTALRLQQAELLAKQSDQYLQPTLSAGFQASRQKTNQIENNHKLSLDLSWEFDVWGRLADAASAANAKQQATQLDYVYAQNSLAARVIEAWLDIAYRARVIGVEQRWLQSLSNTENIVLEQVLDGFKEQADLDTARAATSRVRASLAAKEQDQLVAIRGLNTLRGKSDTQLNRMIFTIPEVEAPPLRLPGEMIGSRPDLLAAYQQVLAADKSAAVAYKDLLPKFTLSASVYRSGSTPNQLIDNPSLWNLVGGISAPLLDQSSLQTQAKIAQLQAEESFVDYQKKLLVAINEVGNALDKEFYLKQQEQHYRDAFTFSKASMKNYQNLYQEGASDVLALLIAQQSIYQSKIQLLNTQRTRLSNRITLGLALGMGV
ncbi:TolC family protein [Vibrio splendidus]|nr:TolC family protein [Vibrio splendidus]MDH5910577.1 TolC family protein [Vibrio splendidus]MDH5943802.1 TolC family protein [Vibrio splendidus]MDH5983435.1 TolC family protein [Vibrio splendidus]MDH5995519.1 TolC family protein [Vibrio splendidus]MDH6003980.1 TolC family protein [Vibrio splendidus]